LFFQFTIGFQIKSIKNKIENLQTKETVSKIKMKIKEELKKGLEKDRILDNDDAVLIKKFIDKINDEINSPK